MFCADESTGSAMPIQAVQVLISDSPNIVYG